MYSHISCRPDGCSATLTEENRFYHLVYTLSRDDDCLTIKVDNKEELGRMHSIIRKINRINVSEHTKGLEMTFTGHKKVHAVTKVLEKDRLLPKPFAAFIYSYQAQFRPIPI